MPREMEERTVMIQIELLTNATVMQLKNKRNWLFGSDVKGKTAKIKQILPPNVIQETKPKAKKKVKKKKKVSKKLTKKRGSYCTWTRNDG